MHPKWFKKYRGNNGKKNKKKNGTFMELQSLLHAMNNNYTKLQSLLHAMNNNYTKHINNNQLQDLPSLLMGHLLPLADHFLVHSLYSK